MTKSDFGYVLFHTSAAAFRTERLAIAAGIPGARLVPTPRELSSDCGVAMRFSLEPPGGGPAASEPTGDAPAAAMARLLAEASVPYDRMVAEAGGPAP